MSNDSQRRMILNLESERRMGRRQKVFNSILWGGDGARYITLPPLPQSTSLNGPYEHIKPILFSLSKFDPFRSRVSRRSVRQRSVHRYPVHRRSVRRRSVGESKSCNFSDGFTRGHRYGLPVRISPRFLGANSKIIRMLNQRQTWFEWWKTVGENNIKQKII